MGRRRSGRKLDGVIAVDKPPGMSSNDVVQKAKRLFGAQKVGHTGSLDPLATGVLPLCFGEATKFSQFLLTSDKKYWTRIKLGVRTNSGDSDGEVTSRDVVENVDTARIEEALNEFRGEIDQIPSMFSAVKHNGQPLYKLARQGIEVERKSRRITIFSNVLKAFAGDEVELEIHCSKGTYIRTIAEDLGDRLGCGAHVIALRRTAAGPFEEKETVTFETLLAAKEAGTLDEYLQPVANTVRQWPVVTLSDHTAYYVRQGQPVIVAHAPANGWVQLNEKIEDGSQLRFIGVGEILEDGRVAPRRLLARE